MEYFFILHWQVAREAVKPLSAPMEKGTGQCERLVWDWHGARLEPGRRRRKSGVSFAVMRLRCVLTGLL